MDVSPGLRAALLALGGLTALGVLAYTAHVAVGAGAMCVLRGLAVRRERLAWLVMGAGVFAWAGGDITWTLLLADDPSPPYPSISDFLYLAFYPASYASLLLVACSRTQSFRSSLWLDGAIAGLTVAADRRADSCWRRLRPVARLVRSSHERFDGSGYPDGLRGDDIPLGARVVAVCDAFDAITTERPYREPVQGPTHSGAPPLLGDPVRPVGGRGVLPGDRKGTSGTWRSIAAGHECAAASHLHRVPPAARGL